MIISILVNCNSMELIDRSLLSTISSPTKGSWTRPRVFNIPTLTIKSGMPSSIGELDSSVLLLITPCFYNRSILIIVILVSYNHFLQFYFDEIYKTYLELVPWSFPEKQLFLWNHFFHHKPCQVDIHFLSKHVSVASNSGQKCRVTFNYIYLDKFYSCRAKLNYLVYLWLRY